MANAACASPGRQQGERERRAIFLTSVVTTATGLAFRRNTEMIGNGHRKRGGGPA